jgi:exopolysaccharide biosynthesis predicted pyruvyltransferase EpsI
MKRHLFYILAAMLYQVGCSESLDVAREQNTEAGNVNTRQNVKRHVGEQAATIRLRSNDRIEAQTIAMESDSTWLIGSQDSLHKVIETADSSSVEVTDRTLGMIEGILFGAATGAMVFDVLHTLSENDNSLWYPWLHGIAGDGAPRGAVVGGLIGALLGYTRGNVMCFNIAESQPK